VWNWRTLALVEHMVGDARANWFTITPIRPCVLAQCRKQGDWSDAMTSPPSAAWSGASHLTFRAFGAGAAVAAGAADPAFALALDGAFGLGAAGACSAGADSALGLTTGAFAVSIAMLLRSASMMLTTLLGRDGCSATFAGIPSCLARISSTTASS
jgi:hypothetical protein